MEVYLDNSATTRQYDEVTDLMAEMARDTYGNPSSLHRAGLAAEKKVKEARASVAGSVSADPEEIIFTACGTESDNTVMMETAYARRKQGKRIITTRVEHPAILEPARRLEEMGFEVIRLDVDKKCRLDLDQLKSAISDDTILISVMAVNNENGTIMPLREIGEIKDEYNRTHGTGILLHTDAVQALGKVPMDLKGALKGVDMLSASAHKIHGPKGMGFLYMKKGISLRPFMQGGGQEKGFRSGTENTPGIAGFGLACRMTAGSSGILNARLEKMIRVREILLSGFKAEIPDILVNSVEEAGVESFLGCPSVLNVSFLGTRGEVILHSLEQEGIYVSTGSACSSNHSTSRGSHVLNAMGLKPGEIQGAIRFSFCEFNTPEEAYYTVEKVKQAVTRFRRLGSFR